MNFVVVHLSFSAVQDNTDVRYHCTDISEFSSGFSHTIIGRGANKLCQLNCKIACAASQGAMQVMLIPVLILL